jgi:hypothetical protein
VQIVVPAKDRYVTPALLEGLEAWSTLVWRRPVDAGHWVIRSHPAEVDQWVREVITYIEEGTESPDLARWRLPAAAATPTSALDGSIESVA